MSSHQKILSETRRSFVQAGAASVAGLGLASRSFAGAAEALALNGGPKAVNFPADRFAALTAWPRYGQEEKDALIALINSGRYYQELPLFEKEWEAFTKANYVKAHMNGTSALTSMFFALDLPAGSEIMVPSYTFFGPPLPMRFFGLRAGLHRHQSPHGHFDVEHANEDLTPGRGR